MIESTTDFSVLLWSLGAVVTALAVHLSQGWVRMAQRGSVLRHEWRALMMAAGVLGVGVSSALVLGMQAQELPFVVGYRGLFAVALLLGAVLTAVPVVTATALTGHIGAAALAAALLSAAVMGLQFGWVEAAGFRPGVAWRTDLLGLAGLVLVLGLTVTYWLAGAEYGQPKEWRITRRVSAGVLGGLVVMAGQELMMLAAGLSIQKVSIYASQVPGPVLSLVCGVVVPFGLVAMTLDLWWVRHQRRHRSTRDVNPGQRRKRRHKVRTL